MKKTIQKSAKNSLVMVWGVHQCMDDLHICEGTIDAEAYVGI